MKIRLTDTDSRSSVLDAAIATSWTRRRGWSWNGSCDKPSVTPSLDVKSGHYVSTHKPGESCWCGKNYAFNCYHCHFMITDGVLHFQNDCSHAMKSKSVVMTEIE